MKQKIYTITYASEVDGELYTETKVGTSVEETGTIINDYIKDIADNFDQYEKGENGPDADDRNFKFEGGTYNNTWFTWDMGRIYAVDVTEHEIEISI